MQTHFRRRMKNSESSNVGSEKNFPKTFNETFSDSLDYNRFIHFISSSFDRMLSFPSYLIMTTLDDSIRLYFLMTIATHVLSRLSIIVGWSQKLWMKNDTKTYQFKMLLCFMHAVDRIWCTIQALAIRHFKRFSYHLESNLSCLKNSWISNGKD